MPRRRAVRKAGVSIMTDTTPRALAKAIRVDAAPVRAARPGNLYRLARRRSTVAFLFALPLLVVVGGLIVYPGIYAVYLSMLNKAQTKFIGFITAHLVNNLPAKGQRKWRGMLLVPWVIPLSLSTLTWWWMFDPTYSAFNWLLWQLFGGHVSWLSSPYWARFCAVLVNV